MGKIAVADYCGKEVIVGSTRELAKALNVKTVHIYSGVAERGEEYQMPAKSFRELKKEIRKGRINEVVLAGGHFGACHADGFTELAEAFASTGRDGTITISFDCVYGNELQVPTSRETWPGDEQVSMADVDATVSLFAGKRGSPYGRIREGSYLMKSFWKSGKGYWAAKQMLLELMQVEDITERREKECEVHPTYEIFYDGKPYHSVSGDPEAPVIEVQIFSSNKVALPYAAQRAKGN